MTGLSKPQRSAGQVEALYLSLVLCKLLSRAEAQSRLGIAEDA